MIFDSFHSIDNVFDLIIFPNKDKINNAAVDVRTPTMRGSEAGERSAWQWMLSGFFFCLACYALFIDSKVVFRYFALHKYVVLSIPNPPPPVMIMLPSGEKASAWT